MFCLLGIPCVLNLNCITNRFLGIDQFFSPFILLFAICGIIASGKNPIFELGKLGGLFVAGLTAFVFVGIVSAFVHGRESTVFSEAIKFTASLGVAIAAILMVSRLAEKGHTARTMNFFFWLSIASVSTVFISYMFPTINATITDSHVDGRFSGTFGNPNEVATQALIATAIGFCVAAKTLRLKYLMICVGVCVPAVLLSHSRSGVVGMAALITTLSFIVFPAKHVIRSAFALVFIGVVVFSGMQYLKFISQNSSSLAIEKRTKLMFRLFQGDIDDRTTGSRTTLATEAIGLIAKQPIVGHGLGYMNNMPKSHYGPHNMILKMLGDSGIIGCFIIGIFGIQFCFSALQCKIRWLKVGLLGIMLAVGFNMMSSHSGWTRRFIVFQFAVMIVFLDPKIQRLIETPMGRRQVFWFKNTFPQEATNGFSGNHPQQNRQFL